MNEQQMLQSTQPLAAQTLTRKQQVSPQWTRSSNLFTLCSNKHLHSMNEEVTYRSLLMLCGLSVSLSLSSRQYAEVSLSRSPIQRRTRRFNVSF